MGYYQRGKVWQPQWLPTSSPKNCHIVLLIVFAVQTKIQTLKTSKSMTNIIQGSELSNYRTVGIGLGVSKNENRDKKLSKFIVFTIANKKNPMAGTRKEIMFEDELPGLFEVLNTFAKDDPANPGGRIVDLNAFKQSEQAAEYGYILEWPGGMVVDYALKKGECYANDVNRKRVKNKFDEDVKRSSIKLFVMVDFAIPGENGQLEMHYFDNFSPEERGQRMEERFWREAVNAAPVAATTPAPETASTVPTF